jgi:hypothetical protein
MVIMEHTCLLCGTTEEPNTWYSDSGVDSEDEVICEFCFLGLRKI